MQWFLCFNQNFGKTHWMNNYRMKPGDDMIRGLGTHARGIQHEIISKENNRTKTKENNYTND